MHHFSVRRRAMLFAGLSCAAVTAGCEDKRVKQIDSGMTRDSVMSVISHDLPKGSAPDSLPNVYLREPYLIGGKNIEVLYFTAHDEKAGKDAVPFSKLTPIVMIDNRVVGRGWAFWDSMSTANKIPLKKKDSVLVLPNQPPPKKG